MKYFLAFAALYVLVSPFTQASTLASKIALCAQNSDSAERLLCYDKLAASINGKDMATTGVAREKKQLKIAQKTQAQPAKTVVLDKNNHAKTTPKVVKTPSTANKAPQKPKQEKDPVAAFGHEKKQQAEAQIEAILASVKAVSKTAYGKYLISLDNQQKWQQTDSNRLKLKPGQKVEIERGFFGSFYLSPEGRNKRISVKRVK